MTACSVAQTCRPDWSESPFLRLRVVNLDIGEQLLTDLERGGVLCELHLNERRPPLFLNMQWRIRSWQDRC
jgi:hypothetical protein